MNSILISKLSCQFQFVSASKVRGITNNEVHKELKKHFNRQKEKRASQLYQKLEFSDMPSQISNSNIQYILTKNIMDKYLTSIHEQIKFIYGTLSKDKLNRDTIFDFYYNWINSTDDLFLCHKRLLTKSMHKKMRAV